MTKKPTVSTTKEAFVAEAMVGNEHDRTDIYDDYDHVVERGSTPDESREKAADAWTATKLAK